MYMAGGLDLIGAMKAGARPAEVVHLGRVTELRTISPTSEGACIGARVTHEQLADHPLVQARIPDIAREWRTLGSPRVRSTGTLGGNLMAGNSSYDAAPILMALDASLVVALPGSERRTFAASDPSVVVEGLLVAVKVPGRERARLLFERSLRPTITLALGLHFQEGVIAKAIVAIGCAYPRPHAWPLELARPLKPAQLAARADKLSELFATTLPAPAHDWRGSAEFRRRMIRVLLRRLLLRAEELPC